MAVGAVEGERGESVAMTFAIRHVARRPQQLPDLAAILSRAASRR
jgi:hypothetical protein